MGANDLGQLGGAEFARQQDVAGGGGGPAVLGALGLDAADGDQVGPAGIGGQLGGGKDAGGAQFAAAMADLQRLVDGQAVAGRVEGGLDVGQQFWPIGLEAQA
jgi:hypothetical protein